MNIVEDSSAPHDALELWKKAAGDYVWLPLIQVRALLIVFFKSIVKN
jgi:hypothetical protein